MNASASAGALQSLSTSLFVAAECGACRGHIHIRLAVVAVCAGDEAFSSAAIHIIRLLIVCCCYDTLYPVPRPRDLLPGILVP